MRKIRAFTHEPVPIKYGTVQPRTTHYVSGSGFLSRTRSGTGGSAPRNPARKDATAVPAKLLNGRRDPACVQIDLREKPWSFTLIEMLAVLVILIILSGSLYIVFNQATRAWRKSEEKLDIYQNARAALQQMSREIQGAVLYQGDEAIYLRGVDADDDWTADANPDIIYFVTPISTTDDDQYELCKIKYEVRTTDHILLRRIDRSVNEPDEGHFEGLIPQQVALNIMHLQFQYFNGANWQNTWDSRPDGAEEGFLPLAVMISVSVAGTTIGDTEVRVFSTTIYLPNSRD